MLYSFVARTDVVGLCVWARARDAHTSASHTPKEALSFFTFFFLSESGGIHFSRPSFVYPPPPGEGKGKKDKEGPLPWEREVEGGKEMLTQK